VLDTLFLSSVFFYSTKINEKAVRKNGNLLPLWHYFVNRKWLKRTLWHIISFRKVKMAFKTAVLWHGTQFENTTA